MTFYYFIECTFPLFFSVNNVVSNVEPVAIPTLSESLLVFIQNPTVQSTALFVGSIVGVLVFQQFALSAFIFSTAPISTAPVITASTVIAASEMSVHHIGSERVGKVVSIACVNTTDSWGELSLVVLPDNRRVWHYWDGTGQGRVDFGDYFTKYLKEHSGGIPEAITRLSQTLRGEIPRLLAEFEKAPFSDPDFLITEIVVRKSEYLFMITYFPGP